MSQRFRPGERVRFGVSDGVVTGDEAVVVYFDSGTLCVKASELVLAPTLEQVIRNSVSVLARFDEDGKQSKMIAQAVRSAFPDADLP